MKILFLTRFDFTGEKKDGGVLCTYRNYKMLCEIYGEDNILACILTPQKKKDFKHIKYFNIVGSNFHRYLTYLCLDEQYTKKQKRKLIDYIASQDADKIFFDGSTFGQIIRNRKIREKDSIVFFHNVERQYTWEQVKKHNILCIFRYITARYNEHIMVHQGKKIICLNKRDKMLIWNFYHRESDLILPITFDDQVQNILLENNKRQAADFELLYVGSYLAHNYTGLIWFINNVMPYVNAHFTIIGKNMEKLRTEISATDKVNIVGTVNDVKPYYTTADAVVMPIFMGGGMKVKTAEALMYGKNIIASKEALEGYDVNGVQGIYECNTSEEFIDCINGFSKQEKRRFNIDARQLFLDKYCTQKYLRELKNTIGGGE